MSFRTAPVSRQLSLGLVMDCIIHKGPLSRAAVAKATGLSKQTVSEVVRELEADGWVRPSGRTRGGVGRTATNYEICPDAGLVAAIDLGGTKLHAAIANLACQVVAEASEPTNPAGGPAVVEQIAALVARLAGEAARDRLRLAVIGTPGVVDRASGAIRMAPNIPGFDTMDVVGSLTEALGCPLIVENDVNVAAIGEQWLGSAKGMSDFVFLALGTGLGMGLLSNGKLVRGAHGAAGEIAYLPIGGDAFDPANRLHGTLETFVGSAGIVARYVAGGGTAGATVRDIFDALAAGDPRAAGAIDETARLMALAILSVATLVDPALIVLGGSVGVRPELIAAIRGHLARCMEAPVPVEGSALGPRAAIVGAIALAINNIHNSLFGMAAVPNVLALPELPRIPGLEIAA